jgi:hypothetical protein
LRAPGFRRTSNARRLLQQVGAPQVAHEDEVARDGDYRVGRLFAVVEQEGDVFGGVSGRVNRVHANVANQPLVAVFEQAHLEALQPAILPVLVAFVGEVERRAGGVRQLACARQKVGVDVRLANRDDLQIRLLRQLQVHIDIASGVNHHRFPRRRASEKVGRLRQTVFVDLSEDHSCSYISNAFCSLVGATRSAWATPISNAALGIANPSPLSNASTVRICRRGIRKLPNGVV